MTKKTWYPDKKAKQTGIIPCGESIAIVYGRLVYPPSFPRESALERGHWLVLKRPVQWACGLRLEGTSKSRTNYRWIIGLLRRYVRPAFSADPSIQEYADYYSHQYENSDREQRRQYLSQESIICKKAYQQRLLDYKMERADRYSTFQNVLQRKQNKLTKQWLCTLYTCCTTSIHTVIDLDILSQSQATVVK